MLPTNPCVYVCFSHATEKRRTHKKQIVQSVYQRGAENGEGKEEQRVEKIGANTKAEEEHFGQDE